MGTGGRGGIGSGRSVTAPRMALRAGIRFTIERPVSLGSRHRSAIARGTATELAWRMLRSGVAEELKTTGTVLRYCYKAVKTSTLLPSTQSNRQKRRRTLSSLVVPKLPASPSVSNAGTQRTSTVIHTATPHPLLVRSWRQTASVSAGVHKGDDRGRCGCACSS